MLEFQDIKWELPSGEPIIKGISCKLNSRLTVITGPNGGGKTSLAKLIAGVEKPTSGKIIFNGTDITDMDITCLLYTSPSPRDSQLSRMPSSA